MRRQCGLLALLAVAALVAAGGTMALRTAPPASAQEEIAAPVPSPTDAALDSACADGSTSGEEPSPANVPGCCTTQCNVDKDCDKICGKGNCACIQQTPCCRRCVY